MTTSNADRRTASAAARHRTVSEPRRGPGPSPRPSRAQRQLPAQHRPARGGRYQLDILIWDAGRRALQRHRGLLLGSATSGRWLLTKQRQAQMPFAVGKQRQQPQQGFSSLSHALFGAGLLLPALPAAPGTPTSPSASRGASDIARGVLGRDPLAGPCPSHSPAGPASRRGSCRSLSGQLRRETHNGTERRSLQKRANRI